MAITVLYPAHAISAVFESAMDEFLLTGRLDLSQYAQDPILQSLQLDDLMDMCSLFYEQITALDSANLDCPSSLLSDGVVYPWQLDLPTGTNFLQLSRSELDYLRRDTYIKASGAQLPADGMPCDAARLRFKEGITEVLTLRYINVALAPSALNASKVGKTPALHTAHLRENPMRNDLHGYTIMISPAFYLKLGVPFSGTLSTPVSGAPPFGRSIFGARLAGGVVMDPTVYLFPQHVGDVNIFVS